MKCWRRGPDWLGDFPVVVTGASAPRVTSVIMTVEATRFADPHQRTDNGHARGGRPVIGISSYTERAQWGTWDTPALLLPRRYGDSVAAAGGIPVLLPPFPGIEHAALRLDGLILCGGGDIDPAEFEAAPHPETGGIRPERDAAEFALVSAALERGLPLLGICRGMQVLNVALGGTLHQHLPSVVGHDGHCPIPGSYGSHLVRVAPGSQLSGILGGAGQLDELPVPTHHHQGIDRLGDGLIATAWAADGVIEAVEFAAPEQTGQRFALGVQWHPEAGTDPRLFRALVAAAKSLAGAAA
jgi:putative glutamine amidotransferase